MYDELKKLSKKNFGDCLQLAGRLGEVKRVGTSGIFSQQLADCGRFVKKDDRTGTIDGIVWTAVDGTINGTEACVVIEVVKRDGTGNEYADDVVTLIENYDDELTDWEREFLESNAQRVEQYGARTIFSDKQIEIIDRIKDKVGM